METRVISKNQIRSQQKIEKEGDQEIIKKELERRKRLAKKRYERI